MNFFFKNQELLTNQNNAISIKERAFMFGDGLFESCKIYNGKIYNFNEHLSRLNRGLKALKINFPTTNLEKQCLHLINKNQIAEGILRISISRGQGSLGYLPLDDIEPLLIIETKEPINIKEKEVNLAISKAKTIPAVSFPVNCKTMQGVSYIINKITAKEKGFFDLIMLSQKNFIAETSSANIFWIKKNTIFTPAKECDIILGTMRSKIIKLIAKTNNFEINQICAKTSALFSAEEVFLANANGVVSVDNIILNKKNINFSCQKTLKIKELINQDIVNSCR